eukprot:CAMPEP_0175136824 /NCGR_PEP_ID=MMETSP0087-20121206/9485_1 /TAXON_ID=136419 /ORGANISM="Unknown Unknown, Strain D1" /LENGTH=803 /DNA_ID=CAMNT_0016419613 /DNA_START=24 /DNA_END=2435 /DNA_ORIENTATION=+
MGDVRPKPVSRGKEKEKPDTESDQFKKKVYVGKITQAKIALMKGRKGGASEEELTKLQHSIDKYSRKLAKLTGKPLPAPAPHTALQQPTAGKEPELAPPPAPSGGDAGGGQTQPAAEKEVEVSPPSAPSDAFAGEGDGGEAPPPPPPPDSEEEEEGGTAALPAKALTTSFLERKRLKEEASQDKDRSISLQVEAKAHRTEEEIKRASAASPQEKITSKLATLKEGRFRLKIFKAQLTSNRMTGGCDPFVKIRCAGEDKTKERKSKIVKGSVTPGFMEEFEIGKDAWVYGTKLNLSVWDSGSMLGHKLLGEVDFDWPSSGSGGIIKGTFLLGKIDKHGELKESGQIELVIVDTLFVTSELQIKALFSNRKLYGLDKYEMKGKLGEGAMGVVKLVLRQVDQKPFALKTAEVGSDDVEIEITQMLKHKNVIKMEEMIEKTEKYYMILELMAGGSMFDVILERYNHNKTISEEEAKPWVYGLLEGVAYLHDMGVIHRDLKPENLMFPDEARQGDVKITDFGISTYKKSRVTDFAGTMNFIAPEIARKEPYGKEVDMWAVGCIIYQVMCGQLPFAAQDQEILIFDVRKGTFTYSSPHWRSRSPEVINLVSSLIVIDRKQRLTPQQAMQHPWFSGMDQEQFKQSVVARTSSNTEGGEGQGSSNDLQAHRPAPGSARKRFMSKIDTSSKAVSAFKSAQRDLAEEEEEEEEEEGGGETRQCATCKQHFSRPSFRLNWDFPARLRVCQSCLDHKKEHLGEDSSDDDDDDMEIKIGGKVVSNAALKASLVTKDSDDDEDLAPPPPPPPDSDED